MKKTLTLCILLVSIVSFTSCNKELAIDIDPLYEGYWEADDGNAVYTIVIEQFSLASYIKVEGISTVSATGRAKIKGDKLSIGIKKFNIDQAPTYNAAQTELTMILDGITYYEF